MSYTHVSTVDCQRRLGQLPLLGWTAITTIVGGLIAWKAKLFGRDNLFFGAPSRLEPDPNNLSSLLSVITREKERIIYQNNRYQGESDPGQKQLLADDIMHSYGLVNLYNSRMREIQSGMATQISYDQLLTHGQIPSQYTVSPDGILMPAQSPTGFLTNFASVFSTIAQYARPFLEAKLRQRQVEQEQALITSQIQAQTALTQAQAQIAQAQVTPQIQLVTQSIPTPVSVPIPETTFNLSGLIVPASIVIVAMSAVVAMFGASRGK